MRVGEPEGQQLQVFLVTLKSEVTVFLFQPATAEQRQSSQLGPHRDDLFDRTDNCVHKGLELGLVVQVVGVADAHEEDVRWQTGDHVDHHAFGFQLWGKNTARFSGSSVLPASPGGNKEEARSCRNPGYPE